ncbi:MAG: hypothetical protein WCT28_00745 [Patescibacteria group bacterium]|jgi:hypothetical protein
MITILRFLLLALFVLVTSSVANAEKASAKKADVTTVAVATADAGLPMPAIGGATMSAGGSMCGQQILAAPWNAKNAGRLVIDFATAERICAEARGDFNVATAKARETIINAFTVRSLAPSFVKAAETGGDVRVKIGDSVFESGQHLQLEAFGTAVAAANPSLSYGTYDPNLQYSGLARISGVVPMGTMVGNGYAAMPQMLGQQASTATASCGTADECQKKLEALQSVLAERATE